MLLYCLKCRKNTESKNRRVVDIMLLSNCAICGSKLKFIKEQEAKGLLSMIGNILLLRELLI